jgi:hypothetical protein
VFDDGKSEKKNLLILWNRDNLALLQSF